ncbi:NADPH-dependent FMN reductase [Heyndrickxia oleronia]|uniref:NAD(P)H-dependent oxidoreductase n=1 Tax=Heyndrickxia oleronia TaxID=38875 RepID=A0A8E2LFD5_9BACI|nr:NAD(P)H-dependent oxidoreductase [Heyndrickxia oleronia]NYV68467.1 NAD(P)H-dependent oxidoreductase [Bacillus sp. Gen3]OJH20397.1 NADPH-dependent FMN reductase [Bacillus obstructivus]MBU5211703.1 NAD(P)H-dependent oxidoreductase [Heyndrickxia oleronia]MCM3240479.1 NAD(P)H-dependent oxidoreductase [Heyndrickxia oleronia]MDH5164518.1 NAD(P)H-dependent oxidoreductase [Heyndrickxia oleronia]
MKIVAIVGSIRKESYNLKLAKYIQTRYAERFDLEILNIKDLPHYDQDIEMNPPEVVTEFKGKVAEADAVLWVTPEFNYSIPGVLKNAIDWLSRVEKVMIGKPSWIMGATMGALGTVRAQQHLRDILFCPGVGSPLLPGNEVYVGAVHEKIDESGNLTHEPTVKFIDLVVDNFINWMNQR